MAAGSHNFKIEQGADFNNTIAATTATYDWNRAFYDLDITLSNVVTRLLQGQIQVIKSVSG
jgi:hypothetical protein